MKSFTQLKELQNILSNSKKAVIFTHFNPDGDAIGSSLGLYHHLKNLYIEAQVIIPNDCTKNLKWMPGFDHILSHETNPEDCAKIVDQADLIFFLDLNQPSRMSDAYNLVGTGNQKKVLIDHHPNPDTEMAGLIFSETEVSSTAELIYEIIERSSGTFDKNIASCLLTAIMTDTGCFNFNSSRPQTYYAVARLLETGIEKNEVFEKVFNINSESRMRLMGLTLKDKMKVFPEYKAAYISLSKEELYEYGFQKGDTEGFVNLPLSIDGIIFTAIFMEKDDAVKISLRSKGNFDVNQVSNKYFNGGGHVNAAGGISYDSLEDTVQKFESILPQYHALLHA